MPSPPAFHLARSVLAANLRRPPSPFKLTHAITYRCNSRCKTCGIWERDAPPELSLEEIERLYRTNPSLAWIDLTGGEVTLRRDFVEICAAAIRHCPGLYLLHYPTNGLLPERAEAYTRAVLDQGPNRLIVSVSIDGPPALHDELRGGAGFHARAIETLDRLRGLARENPRLEVFPGMTLSVDNLGYLQATAADLSARLQGFQEKDLHVNIAHVSGHYYGNVDLDTGFRAQALQEIQAFARRKGFALSGVHALERAYLKLAARYVRTGKTPLPCQALSASCFLDPSGVIYPCNADGEALGSLKEWGYDLAALWASDRARATRARIRAGRCPHCWTPCEAYQTLLSHLPRVAACQWG